MQKNQPLILFIDCHEHLIKQSKTTPPATIANNLMCLIECANKIEIPYYFLTVPQPADSHGVINALQPFQHQKNTFFRTHVNPFHIEDFTAILLAQKAKDLILVGSSIEVGVYITAINALEKKFNVFIAVDDIAGSNERTQNAMLSQMQYSGIQLTCIKSILAQLTPAQLQDSSPYHFYKKFNLRYTSIVHKKIRKRI